MADGVEVEEKVGPRVSTIDTVTKAADLSFLSIVESRSGDNSKCASLAPISKERSENDQIFGSDPKYKETKDERNAQFDRMAELLKEMQNKGCVTAEIMNETAAAQANKAMVALAKDLAGAGGNADVNQFNKLFGQIAEKANIEQVNKLLQGTNFEFRSYKPETPGQPSWWTNPKYTLVDKTTNTAVLEYTNPATARSSLRR